ncbi:hypothetical protein VPH35_122104 [Triticum aestivum]
MPTRTRETEPKRNSADSGPPFPPLARLSSPAPAPPLRQPALPAAMPTPTAGTRPDNPGPAAGSRAVPAGVRSVARLDGPAGPTTRRLGHARILVGAGWGLYKPLGARPPAPRRFPYCDRGSRCGSAKRRCGSKKRRDRRLSLAAFPASIGCRRSLILRTNSTDRPRYFGY